MTKTFPSPFTRMGESLPVGAESNPTKYATRKGKEFTTTLTDLEAYKAIAGRGSDFAKSLHESGDADNPDSYGLSYEMWLWVHIIASEGEKKGPRLVFGASPLTKIVEHFDRAIASKIKFPKVLLETEDGVALKLSRAGGRAKFPGTLNVTDGKPFGENKWFGRVLRSGVLEAGKDLTPEVEALLAAFNADPAKVARTHGLLTGNCCFCRKELTTGESLTAGYGPICADKFGLPWGEVDPEVRDLARHIPDEEANSLLDDGPNEDYPVGVYGDGHSPTV